MRKQADGKIYNKKELATIRQSRKKTHKDKVSRKKFGDTGSNETNKIYNSMTENISKMISKDLAGTKELVDSKIWLEINKLIVAIEQDDMLALIELNSKDNLELLRGKIRGLRLVRSIFEYIEEEVKI